MSFTKNVWINGICKTSSIVHFATARIISSTFSLQMSLCGWYNVFLPPGPLGRFGLVCFVFGFWVPIRAGVRGHV